MAVYLALDLILKHAAGLGQLTHHDEDLAAVDELAVLGTKRDLLTDQKFVRWHLRYLAGPALLPVLRGFLALPRALPPERGPPRVTIASSPASISRRMASFSESIGERVGDAYATTAEVKAGSRKVARTVASQASRAAQQPFITVAAGFALGYAAALLIHRRQ